jgi:hypothetical protein
MRNAEAQQSRKQKNMHECADLSRIADASNCIMHAPTKHVGHWQPTETYTMANNPNDRSQQGNRQEGMGRDTSAPRQEGQGKTPQGDRSMSGQQDRKDNLQQGNKGRSDQSGSGSSNR